MENDPFIDENSTIIQRMFVHAFACCVRRNAKIELDYLIRNHASIYYDSCRSKPNDIRHNILTYCVLRNLATIFDQLMTNMKAMMYKTFQASVNPGWQPHMAWREIIHVIIDPVVQQGVNVIQETNDFIQLASYGDYSTNYNATGSTVILHTTPDEYMRCVHARKNLISKAKRRLTRAQSETNRPRPKVRRIKSLDRPTTQDSTSHSTDIGDDYLSDDPIGKRTFRLSKRSKNILRTVGPWRWGNKEETKKPFEQSPTNVETISLVSNDEAGKIEIFIDLETS